MIEVWLELPTFGVFAALAVVYAGVAVAIVWLCFGRPVGPVVGRFEGVVAPFFGAVSVLFALLTGFLASDVGDRNRQATRAVQAEVGELRNVYTLSVASATDMRAIRAAWSAYIKTAIADDWPAMEDGRAAASVDAAYEELLRQVSDPTIAAEAGAAAHNALINATVRAGTARSDRLALAADRTSDIKWQLVLLLGIMTQIAVAVVHLQKRNAQIAALAVFSVAMVMALGLIAMQERPFAGDVRIGAWPLEELLKQHAANGT
ncbi:MAG TPA: hypothetical protein VG986_12865 [Pseudolabrys sp.]|nr:hypothetical protein [Pseudolabrys sp.]